MTRVERRLATAHLRARKRDLAACGSKERRRVRDRVREDEVAEARREELKAAHGSSPKVPTAGPAKTGSRSISSTPSPALSSTSPDPAAPRPNGLPPPTT